MIRHPIGEERSMRVSAYVGRVGGLAIALGIGVAITIGGPVAAAAPGDSSAASDQDSTAAATASRPSVRSRAGRSAVASAASASPRSGGTGVATSPAQANNSSPAMKVTTSPSTMGRPTVAGNPVASAATAVTRLDVESVAAQRVAGLASSSAPGVFMAAAINPSGAVTAQPAAASGAVDSVLSTLFGSNPGAPVESPMGWVAVAAARRQSASRITRTTSKTAASTSSREAVSALGQTDAGAVSEAGERGRNTTQPAAALAASTSSPQANAPVAAVEAADPISSFIGQIQAFVTQIVQAVTGVVTQFVQAVTQAVKAIINVFVPMNAAPIAASPTVGTPDPATGVVTGQINATDPNGDTLTYTGSSTTIRGNVVVGLDGSFIYTPARWAQRNEDSFTATVDDGHGGTAVVTVPVVADPGTSAAGVPNGVTAHKIEANVPGWGNGSNFYGTDDGHYFVVTVDLHPYSTGWITYIPFSTLIILTDQNVRSDDLGAEWTFAPGTTHEEAIALAGFALQP